jgi:hypothetical protein
LSAAWPLAVSVLAAADARPAELSVRGGLAWSSAPGVYEHRYVPALDFDPTSGGAAEQTLTLDPARGLTGFVTLALRPARRVGLELFLGGTRQDLGGASGAHEVTLHYTARPPPDLEPRRVESRTREDVADPSGRLRQTILGLGARVRVGSDARVRLAISAGPTLQRLSGELGGLAYAHSFLGGHSVLFRETYLLLAELPARWKPGVHAGAELAFAVSGRASLVLEVRGFAAGEVRPRPALARILNADELPIGQLTPAEIGSRLSPAPLALDPSFVAASAGFLLRF